MDSECWGGISVAGVRGAAAWHKVAGLRAEQLPLEPYFQISSGNKAETYLSVYLYDLG